MAAAAGAAAVVVRVSACRAGTAALTVAARLVVTLMLRRIELVKESQSLQQQLGVIGERVTAERDDILCQTRP